MSMYRTTYAMPWLWRVRTTPGVKSVYEAKETTGAVLVRRLLRKAGQALQSLPLRRLLLLFAAVGISHELL